MGDPQISACTAQASTALQLYSDTLLDRLWRSSSKKKSRIMNSRDGNGESMTYTAPHQSLLSVDTNLDIENDGGTETILYLAYGSNLAAETFKGRRGVKPLSQVNVVVPELSLSFDLPGIPYAEPCFANTRRRELKAPRSTPTLDSAPADREKVPLITNGDKPDYHKDRWKKGLVGVVYEVTKKDYATIIATEGGGSAYQDVLVTCHPLADAPTVPERPDATPFKAHTLFAPVLDSDNPRNSERVHRPDPSYAQPSARYLKLITDGAEEHSLPVEYMDYLYDLRPYTITQTKQRLGQFLFLLLWMPVVLLIFGMGRLFADKKGRSPAWFAEFSGAVFTAVWASYDEFFKKLFGEGERTVGLDESSGSSSSCQRSLKPQRVPESEIPLFNGLSKNEGRYETFPQ